MQYLSAPLISPNAIAVGMVIRCHNIPAWCTEYLNQRNMITLRIVEVADKKNTGVVPNFTLGLNGQNAILWIFLQVSKCDKKSPATNLN